MNKIIHQQFLFDFIKVTIEITTVNRFPGRLAEVNRRFSIGLHNMGGCSRILQIPIIRYVLISFFSLYSFFHSILPFPFNDI